MVWPHLHHERWTTTRCGKPRQVHSVVKKWAEDKWNVNVVGQVNNQVFAPRPTHKWRDVLMVSEGTSIKNEEIFFLV
jgi:hypothetical protein